VDVRGNQAQQRPSDLKQLLVSVEAAADMLGIGRNLCYQLIGSGELASVKIKGRRLIPVAAMHAYIRRLMEEAG